jgi:hypothetical protein
VHLLQPRGKMEPHVLNAAAGKYTRLSSS